MNEDEFYQNLRDFELSLGGACQVLFYETQAVINPKHITTALARNGRLSEPMTAAFRMLFKRLKENVGKD